MNLSRLSWRFRNSSAKIGIFFTLQTFSEFFCSISLFFFVRPRFYPDFTLFRAESGSRRPIRPQHGFFSFFATFPHLSSPVDTSLTPDRHNKTRRRKHDFCKITHDATNKSRGRSHIVGHTLCIRVCQRKNPQDYSTVTDLARLRGISTSFPLLIAM